MERFIAFAINWVSRVPAAPTTVPAIIMAALPSTKPSNATASPVSALYNEITTGISAPPMGRVFSTPKASASAKKISSSLPPVSADITSMPPSTRVRPNTARLKWCCSGKRSGRLMSPCSLAKATREPEKETEPIRAPLTASARKIPECSSPLSNSTAAMAAAAPPPMPLYSAIICGMSVMETLVPVHHAATPPMKMAAVISR